MEEKYVIQLDYPYIGTGQPLYVESIITYGEYLFYWLTYNKGAAELLKDRRPIRRCMNKIVSYYINRTDIEQQPKPRAIKIN